MTSSRGGALRAPLPARKAIELANLLFTPCGWSSAVGDLGLQEAEEARVLLWGFCGGTLSAPFRRS